jgi:flagellar protein FlgJ
MLDLVEGTPEFQEFVRTGGREGGPLVQNIIGEGESEFAKKAGATQASQYATLTETGFSASRNLRELDALESALGGIQTGGGASVRSYLGRFGIATEGLDAIQAAEAAINRLVPAQRQPGSGPMSDADLALFKRSLPSLINQPGGNQIIIDTIRAINEYDVAVSILAGQALDGDLTPAEARAAIRELPNPLAEFSAETTAPARAEGAAAGDDLRSAFMADPRVQRLSPEQQEAAWEIYRQQVGE